MEYLKFLKNNGKRPRYDTTKISRQKREGASDESFSIMMQNLPASGSFIATLKILVSQNQSNSSTSYSTIMDKSCWDTWKLPTSFFSLLKGSLPSPLFNVRNKLTPTKRSATLFGRGETTDEKGVFIQIQNAIVRTKALVLVMRPLPRIPILDLKQGWTGMKIAKMAKSPYCIPLFNND